MNINFKNINFSLSNDEINNCLNESMQSLCEKLKDKIIFNSVKQNLLNLSVIVTFGDGFWAGSDIDYTLVYHKKLDKFFFISIDYWEEEIEIREVLSNNQIFKFLNDFDDVKQFDIYDNYFKNSYKKLRKVNVKDLGFNLINDSDFLYIWWVFSPHYRDTLKKLKNKIKKIKEEYEKQQKIDFYNQFKDKPLKLIYKNNKLFILFDGKIKKEILF